METRHAFVGDQSGQVTILKLEQDNCSLVTTFKGHTGTRHTWRHIIRQWQDLDSGPRCQRLMPQWLEFMQPQPVLKRRRYSNADGENLHRFSQFQYFWISFAASPLSPERVFAFLLSYAICDRNLFLLLLKLLVSSAEMKRRCCRQIYIIETQLDYYFLVIGCIIVDSKLRYRWLLEMGSHRNSSSNCVWFT